MRLFFRFFLFVFFIINLVSFSLVVYNKPKKCAASLKAPFAYAEQATNSLSEKYFLGTLLSTIYVGTYIGLKVIENKKECKGYYEKKD